MTQFIEFQIDGKVHLVNIDNIAIVKQIDINTLEFSLLTKDKNNEQIKFKLNYPYGDLKFRITEMGRFMYSVPFIVQSSK